MQVPLVCASITEDDVAAAQYRPPLGRAWYFGDREYSGRQRDLENKIVVGGMRRPVESLARVPGLREVGLRLRQSLELFVAKHPQLLQLSIPGQGEAVWTSLRGQLEGPLVAVVARVLQVPLDVASQRGPNSAWRSHLVRGFCLQANDPERYLADWLRDGAPIGVAKPIPESGIFPTLATAPSVDLISSLYAWSGGHVNYVSVRENRQGVEAELARLVSKGYIVKFDNWETLSAEYKGVIVSKLAAITKIKPDGTVKLRLIVDMLRSGLNKFVKLNERILLPRIRDVIKDVMSLLGQENSEEDEVELAVVDFVDAYQTIGVHPDERKHQVIAGFDGSYYVMCSVAFGGAGSPLIWGRAAAFLGRSGQSLFLPSEARLEIYVDDPFAAFKGTAEQRTWNLTILMLWWLSLGPDLSWAKAQRGSTVKWIGAEISIDSTKAASVTLPSEFIGKLLANIRATMGAQDWTGYSSTIVGTVDIADLRTLAGRASWAASIVPCFGAMLEPIWAVLAEYNQPGRHPQGARIPRRRIALACSWMIRVLLRLSGALHLTYHVDVFFGEPTFVITVDASPWGLGGFVQYKGEPLGWFAERVQTSDVEKFGIVIGSHKFQTLLEALAVLVAVRIWSPIWKGSRATLRVRSDSLSTLGAVNKLRSKTPGLAAIMREIALDCAEGIYTLQVLEHLPGELNVWADALSRIWQPGQVSSIPTELLNVTQCHPPPRNATWWKLQEEPNENEREVRE